MPTKKTTKTTEKKTEVAVKKAKVNVTLLNMRKEPKGDIIATLHEGTTLTVIEDAGEWLHVEAKKEKKKLVGFVMSKYTKGV